MDNQRHQIILNELDKKGNVTVASLVELTGASESSIRRDLVELDHQGFLKRVHGGATLIPKVTQTIEDPLGKRQLLNADEKKKIAKYAAGMIEANDVVYLDAGSSTLELIEYLDQKEAHYITNGLMQAQQLTLKGFHVVCLGGEVRNITGACVGANTMKSLSRYHFSKGFFGTNGIDLMNGFTTPDSEEAAIKELAMERCQMSYILSDHSKFNKVYHVTFGQINDAVIITDHCEKEIKEQKQEITELENNLSEREKGIERRDIAVQGKEDVLEQRIKQLDIKEAGIDKLEAELKDKIDSKVVELEKVAAMSAREAKEELFKQVEQQISLEMSAYIKEQEEEAKSKAADMSRDIIANAINRYAQEEVTERTVTVVDLPSEEMKGRIIGREGRNIKAIEQATGADLIIDDTPEAITISCFDPVRREVARLSLETLIRDGRIQPGRIEEVVDKTRKELDEVISKTGENAIFELGISRIDKEIVKQIGKLKYRTSYGQNALQHSLEVAHLAGIMAAELGLNQQLAKRAGLLHDIGKAVDHEMEGSHIQLGVDLCRRYKESALVINAVEAHHGDVEPESLIACLVQAADTISAARPGARRETLETYTNRLKQLEDITNSFKGVEKSFAIQAGREVRVMVVPEVVSDSDMVIMARDISKQIEDQMEYPGQIKVSIVRESRAVDYAK